MIEYDVQLRYPTALSAELREWLAGHVQEMLCLPGFLGATVMSEEALEPEPPSHEGLCVRYRLHDHLALQHYLREYAPQMRARLPVAFVGQVHFERRVWAELVEMLAPEAPAEADS